jgi:MoxR-like ATPase
MGMRFGSFSCNMEASKSELIGFQNLNGYVESSFLNFYENGGVFLVDEYDAMSSSISVVLNAAFDRSGQISVPNRVGKPVAKKHPNFYCILAGNTWGTGSVEYHGRDMQDAAFLDRFKMCRLFVDYDENVERNISNDHYPWLMKIREFMKSHVDNEKFSTRSVYDASVLLENGCSKKDILESISFHWDETIREKLFKQVG